MESILDQITSPDQLKALKLQQQEELAAELRSLITASVAVTGGHLASNLGTIELTIALLRNFDLLQDRLVWDVGHQSYAYKILTGRRDRFATLRQQDGLSGFPKREESPYDSFNTGHSSTAVSAALGLSRAMRMQGKEGRAIAVVGDGAMTGGMFTEALNNINTDEDNLLIIINDNQMSIGKNVGLFSRHLADIRVSQRYIGAKKTWSRTLSKLPFLGVALLKLMNKIKYQMRRFVVPSHENIYFEALGLRYYGPIDGHDMAQLNRYLTALQAINAPIVLHVCTQKGRGYEKAELSPDLYHGVSPFSPEEGLTPSTKEKKAATHSFTKAFSEALLQEAEKNERIVAITAAMEEGTGLAAFARRYPERFYDVGIAEQHAVTFAAALAAGGLRPVVCIYATFLQRALDQLLHDVVLQRLPVIFGIDRSGIVGADGETHQGLYDAAFLSAIPDISIFYPSCYLALRRQLTWAFQQNTPVALRYPRGSEQNTTAQAYQSALTSHATRRDEGAWGMVLRPGKDACILALGTMADTALELAERAAADGYNCQVYDVECMKPLDEQAILQILRSFPVILTLEEQVSAGGLGEKIALLLQRYGLGNLAMDSVSVPNKAVYQATQQESRVAQGLDGEASYARLQSLLRRSAAAGIG